MNRSPIQTMNTYEAVLQHLLDSIKTGQFPPNSKLPSVRQLSIDLQVGQPTVREALSALKAMNLITAKQGEGTFVNDLRGNRLATIISEESLMTASDVSALLELRMILETGSAKLAARRRTTADVNTLKAIIAEMEADLAFVDLGEQADWKFHFHLAKSAQNPYLSRLMESMREQMQSSLLASRLALYRQEGEPERLLQQHRSIVAAVEEQNEVAAVQAMGTHLQHVELMLNSPEGEGR